MTACSKSECSDVSDIDAWKLRHPYPEKRLVDVPLKFTSFYSPHFSSHTAVSLCAVSVRHVDLCRVVEEARWWQCLVLLPSAPCHRQSYLGVTVPHMPSSVLHTHTSTTSINSQCFSLKQQCVNKAGRKQASKQELRKGAGCKGLATALALSCMEGGTWPKP